MKTLILALIVLPGLAHAHPGGLDASGCHKVTANYRYTSGAVVKKGDYHCHRKVGEIRFDGKEVLRDEEKETKAPAKRGKSK